MTYDLSAGNVGAKQGLLAKRGVCEEYASLFVAMCRAAGIPARTVNGMWLQHDKPLGQYAQHPNTYHQWAEVYLSGKWVIVDPTAAFDGRRSPSWGTFANGTGKYFIGGYGQYVIPEIETYYPTDTGRRQIYGGIKKETKTEVMKMASSLLLIDNLMDNIINLDDGQMQSLTQRILDLPESKAKSVLFSNLRRYQSVMKANPLTATQIGFGAAGSTISHFKDVGKPNLKTMVEHKGLSANYLMETWQKKIGWLSNGRIEK